MAVTLGAVGWEDGAEAPGWAPGGAAATYNYGANSPALLGDSSFSLSGGSATNYSYEVSPEFDASGWFSFLFKCGALNASSAATLLELRDVSGNVVAYLQLAASNPRFLAGHGSVTANSASDLVASNWYRIWVRYVESTGTDGVLQIYYAANSHTRPGSPAISITTGTSTAAVRRVALSWRNRAQGYHLFDDFRAANEELFDNGLPADPVSSVSCTHNSVSVTFAQAVYNGAAGAVGLSLNVNNGMASIPLTYASGSGTTGYTFTPASTLYTGYTYKLEHSQPGNGLEYASGVDVPSFIDKAVTNSSATARPSGKVVVPMTTGVNPATNTPYASATDFTILNDARSSILGSATGTASAGNATLVDADIMPGDYVWAINFGTPTGQAHGLRVRATEDV